MVSGPASRVSGFDFGFRFRFRGSGFGFGAQGTSKGAAEDEVAFDPPHQPGTKRNKSIDFLNKIRSEQNKIVDFWHLKHDPGTRSSTFGKIVAQTGQRLIPANERQRRKKRLTLRTRRSARTTWG